MAEREGYNQIYRQSQLGLSLQSALEDLDDQIDPSLRQKVFNHFDRVVHETLAENTAKNEEKKGPMMRVKADPSVSDDSKLESYRFCEETWTMELTDCELQLPGDAPPLRLPRTMIVAVQNRADS